MKLHSLVRFGFWTLGFGLSTLAAQTNLPGRLDYSSFKIVTDRNIFNSHRSPTYKPRADTRRQTKYDFLALTGTMSYEKGPFAFFDGSSSDYRKTLQPNGDIAGFKVLDIEPWYVKLASPTNEIELRVGMQLRREGDGEWRLSERPESSASSSEPGVPSRPIATAAPPAQPDAPTSDTTGDSIVFVDPETQTVIREPLIEGAVTNAAPGTASGGGESDILERLRRRREQESTP